MDGIALLTNLGNEQSTMDSLSVIQPLTPSSFKTEMSLRVSIMHLPHVWIDVSTWVISLTSPSLRALFTSKIRKKKDIPLCFQAHGLSSCASILYNVGFSEEPNGANYQLNNGDIHTLFSNRRSSRLLQPIRMKQWPFNKRLHLAWLILRDTQAHLACVKWLVRKYWQLETIPRATKQWSGR